jgi:hypothetical protein
MMERVRGASCCSLAEIKAANEQEYKTWSHFTFSPKMCPITSVAFITQHMLRDIM